MRLISSMKAGVSAANRGSRSAACKKEKSFSPIRYPGHSATRSARGCFLSPRIDRSRFFGTLLGRCSYFGSPVQDTAHGGAADVEAACDFGFACAGAAQFPDLIYMQS